MSQLETILIGFCVFSIVGGVLVALVMAGLA
jgi:hypothetical protein